MEEEEEEGHQHNAGQGSFSNSNSQDFVTSHSQIIDHVEEGSINPLP